MFCLFFTHTEEETVIKDHLCDRVHDLVEHVVNGADHEVSNHGVTQRADRRGDQLLSDN